MNKFDEKIVCLNVEGIHHIQTYKDVLLNNKKSKLLEIFSEIHQLKMVDNEVV